MESLSSELVLEILSRTAFESIEDCKSVCKNWKEIIYEPRFIHFHSERSNSIFGYFIQGLKDNGKYPWAFISATATAFSASIKSTWPSFDDIKILASCDQGILICERRIPFNNQFFACKPATAQWQALPSPKLGYETVAIAVVVLQSQPLRYLIARLY